MKKLLLSLFVLLITITTFCQKKKSNEKNTTYNNALFNAFKFRSIGPAFTAGRISDLAVVPNSSTYYIAVASGGVWKTTNWGNTYSPIFDNQGSYSIGCITIDPSNPNIVWVGTGENNNQRSVAYGDGVYKSEDGGKTWENMGLKNSEHISKIIVHPNNSNIVYVASYGPLWSKGGERGVYKSEDGGKTWTEILSIDEHTGIADLVIDPNNPDVLYASAHQRRRHVFTYIGGGPSSGLHKSENGGKTWKKISAGLPSSDIGRIGLAISPVNSTIVYAIVEAANKEGGFYKSTNYGVSWNKMSKYSTSGNYYQEIVCDPKNENIVYAMDTWLHHTEDGGKTFKKTGEKSKHVDNHCMWIDPNNTKHWLVGCDGGLYETWDAANNWQYKPNLPITQFYKVSTDNDYPFYNIYGGTQDNNSQGGPSRTTNNAGIVNSDWYITNGGDGFESQIDPKNPNIVYAQSQYGWLVRYDKKSGEKVGIKPYPNKNEPGLRWNWDAPLLISPHNHKTLYFAANKLFKSTDRGDTWTAISDDLTRQLDRNKMKVMGKIWSIDAVMKNKSTTIYGNIVALDESPLQQGLIYVGTDDGLIQVSDNDGKNWIKYTSFGGVPNMTYVNMIKASQHDVNTVYAVFNNHKRGDFKPYILISNDKGKTWTSIANNLPDKGSIYCIAEDHIDPNILFVGTEFGVFVTLNKGKEWYALKSGLPTIAVRDMEIQKRENDLVLGTFGRSFYVLDNYSALREIEKEKVINKQAHMFDIKKGLMFIESNPLGYKKKNAQGESFYTAENPPVGVTFSYFLKDTLKTKKQIRQAVEKKSENDYYPSFEEIREEKLEEEPQLIFVIKNDNDEVVKKLSKNPKAGINHIVWNFRHSTTTPIKLKYKKSGRYGMDDDGYLAMPGKYTVTTYLLQNDSLKQLINAKEFEIELLNNTSLPAEDKLALLNFQKEVSEIRRQVRGAAKLLDEATNKLKYINEAILVYNNVDINLISKARKYQKELKELEFKLWGDYLIGQHEFETYPSIFDRIETVVYGIWNSTSAPSNTAINNIKIATEEFKPVLAQLNKTVAEINTLQKKLDTYKTPYTPGRDGNWKEE